MAAKQQARHVQLYVKDFEDAVKQLLDLVHNGTAEGKTKVLFFNGWHNEGLGASAVLRAISKLLKSTRNDSDIRKYFDKIIHVDCSVWKNRRAMQRVIAEELNLHHLMPFFDKQDEEDDFRGVDDSSRVEIETITSAVNESLRNERFLMIFHYGGNDDIDLAECGIPIFGKGKVLCTKYGSFQIEQREQKLMSVSSNIDICMFSSSSEQIHINQQVRLLLHEEAVALIGYTGMDKISPEEVVDCFLYSVFLTEQVCGNSYYDWATHACNYWICDGIFYGERAWEIANILCGFIPRLDNYTYKLKTFTNYLDRQIQPYIGWNSTTSRKQGADDISTVHDNASSYFLTFKGDGKLLLQSKNFQQASNIRVLKLHGCKFDFSSPSFKCCHNLRFLWLDWCTNTSNEQGGLLCFPNLLVLDIRYSYYFLFPQMIELMNNLRELNTKGVSWRAISHAWKNLQNLHKLRVTKFPDVITVDNCSSIDMMNLELLDMSSNTYMKSLPEMSSARSLKVLVLDGCSSLEHIAPGEAPELLESFSYDGYGQAENWTYFIQLPKKELRPKSRSSPLEAKVTKISLEGCAQLHSIFLRALPNLKELDLSGTAINTLDLGAMDVPQLKKLFLIGCKQLRELTWDETPRLSVLHVDTRGNMRSVVCCGEQGHTNNFEACISFTDGRLLGAFMFGLYIYTPFSSKMHLHISSIIHNQVNIAKSIEEIGPNQEGLVPRGSLLPYNDIVLTKDVTCCPLVWDHQQLHLLGRHIEIGKGSHNLESMLDDSTFQLLCSDYIESLHVHDNSSITTITIEAGWCYLKWCHIEKCPKLHTLFICPRGVHNFGNLNTISACDLLMADCIWGRGINTRGMDVNTCFDSLQHIYLHNCPRLVFVLPISFTLPNLETLQISYCHNLRHVFPLDKKIPIAIASGVTFKNLKCIKLYHLHKLEQICEARLTTPALDMIILRDCWGLRRLPAVSRQVPKPVVDCEKDLWDKLKWEGLEAGHDPSLFETRHSAYYKKTIPRVSLLR